MAPRLIPLTLALAWGLNWPVVKIVLGGMPPFTFRAVGLGGAAVLLMALALARRTPLWPTRADVPGVLLGGVLTVAAFSMCTAFAQLLTSTSRAAVLTYTMPMISAVLSRLFLGERLAGRHHAALALGAVGIAVLAWPVWQGLLGAGAGADLGAGTVAGVAAGVVGVAATGAAVSEHAARGSAWLGLLLPLLAASAWAAGSVAAKRWPLQGDRVVNTAWQLAIGGVVGVLGAVAYGENLPSQLSGPVWLGLIYHIVIATAWAYVLWFQLLDRLSATVSALTTLAVPVVGVLGAMLLVGDRPSLLDGLGFMLVLSGAALAVVRLRSRS